MRAVCMGWGVEDKVTLIKDKRMKKLNSLCQIDS
jgi:hypothetical protein